MTTRSGRNIQFLAFIFLCNHSLPTETLRSCRLIVSQIRVWFLEQERGTRQILYKFYFFDVKYIPAINIYTLFKKLNLIFNNFRVRIKEINYWTNFLYNR